VELYVQKIREAAAFLTFEQLHTGTVSVLRKSLFSDVTVKGKQYFGYLFKEVDLLISEVDVKNIEPINKEISDLLNQSIKSNMKILCNKMEQMANHDAKKTFKLKQNMGYKNL